MSDVFREGMAAVEGLEGLRGSWILVLNSQHCDETQTEMHGKNTTES